MLWKKVMPRLSAGRVQSVATRLVVERERERMRFVAAAYWDIEGTFDPDSFAARLVALDGKRVAQGRDFGPDGELKGADALQLDEATARALAERLEGARVHRRSVDEKPYSRRPSPPFMTSTLQQEASRKLRFTAQTTMRVAQRLYERGYITYMRTDSTSLSESALTAARRRRRSSSAPTPCPPQPRLYDRKVKNAQEAHEAIRPAGDRFRTPPRSSASSTATSSRLYDLVWMRTLASQMADAKGQTVSIRLGGAVVRPAEKAEFGASGTVITFRGFLAAYEEGRDEAGTGTATPPTGGGCRTSPKATRSTLLELEPQGHETTPPARYTEATLVKALEERGIGRPSTYASILGTILDRGYVVKSGTALVPTFLAFAVIGLLEQHYGRLVDYDFTARMEDDLDRIAAGDEERVAVADALLLRGRRRPGLHQLVTEHLDEIDARAVNSIEIPAPDIVVRVGRYGPYLERGEQRATSPRTPSPDELTAERAEELLAQPAGDRSLGVDPETGRAIVARTGRYGPYVTEVQPEGSKEKPRTASLFKSMSPETVTLEDALKLLSCRACSASTADGEEIVAMNGRYGPFIQKGKETRSLESEEQLFTITLDEALTVLAQPKQRGGREAASRRSRSSGPTRPAASPSSSRTGRFGPYVTDGETNASLRGGRDPSRTLTLDRAVELLAERRAKGPAKNRPARGRRKTS